MTEPVNPIRTPFGTSYVAEQPTFRRVEMRTYEEHWICTIKDCGGDMVYANYVWPVGSHAALGGGRPAYHHKCDKCSHVAAVVGKQFPRTVNEPVHE